MPKQRLALQQRIEDDLLQDERIIGIFYGGSIGTGTTDIYSDIDVRIVVSDEHYERYRLIKQERANIGEMCSFLRICLGQFIVGLTMILF